ncbi:preprotein translocase subunit YajC [Rothia aeria]|jgi:preprotein translocase, yajC subunit|uniref:preprotein translocase subunit YajC n=1 Tax=Rothia aeria TaxID=172042 RepID=UPI00068AB7F2|nr:preprotein translocase subunit YajC [Rothia aeria]
MDITMILLAVFVLFMIWSIYSGTKRQKAQMQATQTMQENLRAGDEIMTRAGLYGTIVSTDHENRKALVEIAEGTIITISLDAVATVVDVAEEEPVEAKEEAAESTESKDTAEDESPEKPAKGYDLN